MRFNVPMTIAMQVAFTATILLSMVAGVSSQETSSISGSAAQASWRELHLAAEAHKAGRIEDEICIRRSVSKEVWAERDRSPVSATQFDLYDLILVNDLRLALLLEGTYRWGEAEQVFLHNQTELARMKIAGNDIKSENELLLAHLLESEGKTETAGNICSRWKHRVRHLASGHPELS
jgi:hypothetical protein